MKGEGLESQGGDGCDDSGDEDGGVGVGNMQHCGRPKIPCVWVDDMCEWRVDPTTTYERGRGCGQGCLDIAIPS